MPVTVPPGNSTYYLSGNGVVASNGSNRLLHSSQYAIVITGSNDTLINTASLFGSDGGVSIKGNNDTVINNLYMGGPGAESAITILDSNASVTNTGTLVGDVIGVYFDDPGASESGLTNSGLIVGNSEFGIGVYGIGVKINNQLGGTIIAGESGIYLEHGSTGGTITNSGFIGGTYANGVGIYSTAGGSVTNFSTGLISGGVRFTAASGLIVNSGSIVGNSSYGPVGLYAGGTVTNLSDGRISADGTSFGVKIEGGAGTVINAGQILGGADAVILGSGFTNRVIDDPGGYFKGIVDGGNAVGGGAISTLELASGSSAGALSGLGSEFVNFAQTTIDAGATWQFTGTNNVAAGATLGNAGTLDTSGALIDSGVMTNNGRVIINAGSVQVAALNGSGTIAFGGATGDILAFSSTAASGNVVSGMVSGQTLEITGQSVTSANLVNGDTLQLGLASGGPIDINLDPSGNYTGQFFHASNSGGNSFIIENTTPCYLAGTRIRTDKGDVRVEDLAIGDCVITLDGAAKPIKWIGTRSYASAFAAGNRDIIPILIKAGALGTDVPVRDLYVSPLHALFFDDVLIQAEHLVNGASIVRCPHIDPIQYFHIELDQHDVIFAEDAPAETFVDCDSRGMFHNAAEFSRLYPSDDSQRWMFCAPRIESGPILAQVRRVIDSRTGLTPKDRVDVPGPLQGNLDGLDGASIGGWAFDPEHPGSPVILDVLDGHGLIARVTANRFRADLEEAGIGDGRHGFELRLTRGLSPLTGHELRVRRVADGRELAGSPLVIEPHNGASLLRDVRQTMDFAIDVADDPSTLDALLDVLLESTDHVRRIRAVHRRDSGSDGPLVRWAKGPRHRPKRALVIDDRLPRWDRDAGSNAVLSHIAALQALGWQVEFVASGEMASSDDAALSALGVTCHRAPLVASVEEVLRRGRDMFDLVYLHRLSNAETYAPMVRTWQPRSRVVYSVADLQHVRVARQARVHGNEELLEESRRLKPREINAMRMVDAVITHSPAEADYLRQEAPGLPVHVVPWALQAAARTVPLWRRQGVAFVGGMRHAPNPDAVRWLAEEIMPRVWDLDPEMPCVIVGSDWSGQGWDWLDRRMTLVGHVDQLAAVFDQVRLTVAPLRFGAGIKGKVLDSLAAGVPCVMSRIAAEGIPLDGLLRALVSDGPAEMAALICELNRQAVLHDQYAEAGLALVRDHYTDAVVAEAMAAVVGSGTAAVGSERRVLAA
ncbi:Hint domain-containing protein [Acidisphaera sp. S103]|uniref:Hint domain-containing protein n=1 Tax=Acidisphaera sp. S103 TaxID=1747223 RepID=UPI00131BA540|nr:Hint domain-containing protein [Acidisphaera sp. S103]